MTYILLALVFFSTLIAGVLICLLSIIRPRFLDSKRRVIKVYTAWLLIYGFFIIFATGPSDLKFYPPPESSPYKLPWESGVKRFVSQGNRSFTSHRGDHQYAWDFWMTVGTKVLAAREGRVVEVEDHFDGIGFYGNYVKIQHSDGTRAFYAHIQYKGAVVRVGDSVFQGQLIAYSGMVGQTINPHLHFVVLNGDETKSLPISFSDVAGGVPLAGHFYVSKNSVHY